MSVDSMQVYRGMDIGTAKPTTEHQLRVQHYMIDLVEPEVEYSAAEFQQAGRETITSGEHERMLVVGGSGLHFRALVDPHTFPPHDPEVRDELEGLTDPAAALVNVDPGAGQVVDLANRRRVVRALEVHRLTGLTPSVRAVTPEAESLRRYQGLFDFVAAGVDPGSESNARIRSRVIDMGERGFVDEVRSLQGRLGPTARSAVGYRQLTQHLQGHSHLDEAWAEVERATAGLARRQRTYFRRDPRIRWVPWHPDLKARVAAVRAVWGLN